MALEMKIKRSAIYIISIILITLFAINILFSKKTLKVKWINMWPRFTLSQLYMINDILTEKYNVKIVDKDYDLAIYSWGDQPIEKNDAVKIFFSGEAMKPKIDDYDLSIGFDYGDSAKYMRIPLYYFMSFGNKVNTDYNRGRCNPDKKHFACFLFSNSGEHNIKFDGCAARNRIFHQLSLYKKVLSGGRYLNNIGKKIAQEETSKWLSQCKFTIAYENQSYKGYMTEKVFQAYFTGAIPLYYGDSSAVKDINNKAVIYAGDFGSEEEMVEYIKKVDNDDKLYCDIWNEKIITNPEKDYKVLKERLKVKIEELLDARFEKLKFSQ